MDGGLREESAHVRLDGVLAQAELLGNPRNRIPVGGQAQDLGLALGKKVARHYLVNSRRSESRIARQFGFGGVRSKAGHRHIDSVTRGEGHEQREQHQNENGWAGDLLHRRGRLHARDKRVAERGQRLANEQQRRARAEEAPSPTGSREARQGGPRDDLEAVVGEQPHHVVEQVGGVNDEQGRDAEAHGAEGDARAQTVAAVVGKEAEHDESRRRHRANHNRHLANVRDAEQQRRHPQLPERAQEISRQHARKRQGDGLAPQPLGRRRLCASKSRQTLPRKNGLRNRKEDSGDKDDRDGTEVDERIAQHKGCGEGERDVGCDRGGLGRGQDVAPQSQQRRRPGAAEDTGQHGENRARRIPQREHRRNREQSDPRDSAHRPQQTAGVTRNPADIDQDAQPEQRRRRHNVGDAERGSLHSVGPQDRAAGQHARIDPRPVEGETENKHGEHGNPAPHEIKRDTFRRDAARLPHGLPFRYVPRAVPRAVREILPLRTRTDAEPRQQNVTPCLPRRAAPPRCPSGARRQRRCPAAGSSTSACRRGTSRRQ